MGIQVEKRHGKFWNTGLNNWSISKSHIGDGTRYPEGYAFPAGMSQPLQMVNENYSRFGEG